MFTRVSLLGLAAAQSLRGLESSIESNATSTVTSWNGIPDGHETKEVCISVTTSQICGSDTAAETKLEFSVPKELAPAMKDLEEYLDPATDDSERDLEIKDLKEYLEPVTGGGDRNLEEVGHGRYPHHPHHPHHPPYPHRRPHWKRWNRNMFCFATEFSRREGNYCQTRCWNSSIRWPGLDDVYPTCRPTCTCHYLPYRLGDYNRIAQIFYQQR